MKNEYKVIGIMSGTSLDGLDIAYCIIKKDKEWNYQIKHCVTIKYSKEWLIKLRSLHKREKRIINKVNIEYGRFIGHSVLNFIRKYKISCDYICSHGHTIFHNPKKKYSLQIGDGKTIADITNITTINNFRSLDVNLGGQGAPLVPIGDLLLFQKYKYCLNLGGFSNISIKKNNRIIAFDICPVNFVLNSLCRNINIEYDHHGNIAKEGRINKILLKKLESINFYNKRAPKSLGREWVEKNIHPIINEINIKTEDKISTFTEHIAIEIGKILQDNSVLITGGGALNKYLIERIKTYSKSKIIIPSTKLINFKECLIFGLLGVLKIRNEDNCLKSVTGAKRNNCGGVIFHK